MHPRNARAIHTYRLTQCSRACLTMDAPDRADPAPAGPGPNERQLREEIVQFAVGKDGVSDIPRKLQFFPDVVDSIVVDRVVRVRK